MNQNSSVKPIIRIIVVISLAIAIIALYVLFTVQSPIKPLAGQGSTITGDTDIGGDFELIDQNMQKFNSNLLHGKLSLIYFGFTYCPDVCPTSLYKISNIIETLDKYRINVQPVFITIDPERDTIPVLKEYLSHFNHKFIGLTGTKDQIREAAGKFKVYFARAESNNADPNNYMLNHSSFIYLIDKNGKYLKHFYIDTSPEDIIEFIRVNGR
jgi:protein SCO1